MSRIELHRLVEALPDESLPATAILLRRAQDSAAAKLDAAPFDREELTEEDLRAVQDARRESGFSWSEAEAELDNGWFCIAWLIGALPVNIVRQNG